jgi:hypothetical protein
LFTIFDFIPQTAYYDTGVITAEKVAPFVLKTAPSYGQPALCTAHANRVVQSLASDANVT